MELIDKLFFTSALCLAVSFYIIKLDSDDVPENVKMVAGIVFLLSFLAFITFAFGKIWI